uniref:WW domain-containing protein n=2 Tax=Hemiselmis andersenii TaxID=464988 RepID=A0A7S0TLQ5_HEMAN
MAASGEAPDDEDWLREDLAAAQKELESLVSWAQNAEKELFDVEIQMRERVEKETDIKEPDDDVTAEHMFRAKLAGEQADEWTPYEGLVFSAADSAEYAMLWGMTESETHLLWIASAALQAPLPPGWRVCQDKTKQTFYWDGGSRTSTYHHPNDVRYREVFEEMQAYSRSVEMVKLPPLAVEAEQKRLQEAASVLEKHQRALKRRKERLSERHEKLAKEASEEEARRKKLEDASQAERLSLDVEKMKRVAKQDGIAAKEALREEVREEIARIEGASIRQQILEEEKHRIVLEGVKLREQMIREEEELVMKRMEERSPEEMRQMREEIRQEQREHLKAIEKDKMELEIAASRPPYVSARQREKEERLRELDAFTASAQAIDERNRAEVEEYAVYLGMDTVKDKDILWVADMALSAPLPEEWSEHQDANGNIFFYNSKTQASTYEHPMDNTFRQYISKIKRIAR